MNSIGSVHADFATMPLNDSVLQIDVALRDEPDGLFIIRRATSKIRQRGRWLNRGKSVLAFP